HHGAALPRPAGREAQRRHGESPKGEVRRGEPTVRVTAPSFDSDVPTKKGSANNRRAFCFQCGGEDLNLHGIATASPSSWCVCQFRHFRVRGLSATASNFPAAGLLEPRAAV